MNSIQILPHVVKFAELCENRDQFHWIKDTMVKLHETVSMENAIAHQVIFLKQIKTEKFNNSKQINSFIFRVSFIVCVNHMQF